MKRLLFICALMLAACGPAPQSHETAPQTLATAAGAPAQPPRIETLVSPPAEQPGPSCTRDGVWCVAKTSDGQSVTITYLRRAISTISSLGEGEHGVWTQVIRTPRANGEDILIGVTATQETGYSGGGGQATQVTLYQVSSVQSGAPHAALTFPLSAGIDIRACFSPADERMRRDACSDQYNFTGTLSLDASATPAKLVLVTVATTYPAGISRDADNTHALSARDLRTARDPACSYRRVFSWDAASQTYKPDAPLPACSDYLEP
ncbi:MAG TPA: hypothetical protein VHC73_00450 [Vitreimonas sp.]|jgi:hypothetical protein|nr:hypothetical protein [Vitreimonas sp.]